MEHQTFAARMAGRALAAARAALPLLIALPACDSLLDVADNPQTIDARSISGPGAFPARYVGAQSDFIAAFDNAAVYGGLFTDEVQWGGSFLAREEIDLRKIRTSNDIVASELYTLLQVAAFSTTSLKDEILANTFPRQVTDPPNSPQLARIALFAGYAKLYLAELFCTLAFGGTGPEIPAADVFPMAIADFTHAIDAANAEPAVRAAARVGRARAHLQSGRTAEALADAQAVAPEGFEFVAEYSNNSNRQQNAINDFTYGNRRLTIEAPFRALTIDDTGEADPRVQVIDQERTTFNGNVPLWTPAKFPTESSPIRLASWEEAQLIIAEIQGGGAARDIINQLRARRGITQVYDPDGTATAAEIQAKLRDERARILFLEGQRMGDLRRYRAQGADLFPTGPQHGDQTCMPLPDLERDNNPGLRRT